MAKITNLTRETLNFVTGIENGVAITDSIAGGETKDVRVDADDAQFKGRVLAGVISIDGAVTPSAKRQAGPAAAGERRSVPTLGGAAAVRE
jgi:hypothetical protein